MKLQRWVMRDAASIESLKCQHTIYNIRSSPHCAILARPAPSMVPSAKRIAFRKQRRGERRFSQYAMLCTCQQQPP